MFNGEIGKVIEQAIRFLQIIGIPLMAFLCVIGFLILLTSGKNPLRKRLGYKFVIVFGIGILIIAYAPLLRYSYAPDTPVQGNTDSVEGLVDSTMGFGSYIFKGLWYASIPVVVTMFYAGMNVRLVAGKNPQTKRLGLGLMMFSPLVLGIAFVLPSLLGKL